MATKTKTKARAGAGNRRKSAGAPPAVASLIAVTPQGLRQLEKNAHKASDLLGAMANTSRLMIMCQLADGEVWQDWLDTDGWRDASTGDLFGSPVVRWSDPQGPSL